MKKYVIGIGEALFDCLPEGRKLGGAPANFAYHVSQFGLNGCAISAIGDDELGREIIDKFNAVQLKHILPVVEQPTGTVKVTLDDKGVPQYEICLGVAWDNIPLTNEMLDIAHQAQAADDRGLLLVHAQTCDKLSDLDLIQKIHLIYSFFSFILRKSTEKVKEPTVEFKKCPCYIPSRCITDVRSEKNDRNNG